MNSFKKLTAINVAMFSLFFVGQSHAFCAKCAAIEKEREEERAANKTKQSGYYDDEHQDQISTVNGGVNPVAPGKK